MNIDLEEIVLTGGPMVERVVSLSEEIIQA